VPNVVSLDVGKSDVYSTQRRGPRMLPWGTREWLWKRLEVSPLNFVSNWRSFRYDFRKLKQLEGKILLILDSSPGCHTLSNAWLTYRNAAVQYCWFSIALLMTSLSGGTVALWSEPVRIQIDGLDPVLRVQIFTDFFLV
jgi:hypothetical protein